MHGVRMSDAYNAEYWDQRYESKNTPWDFGGVPSTLQDYLKRNPKGGKVLIPGCGHGHEIEAFVAAGYDVTAVDLSPVAVQRVQERVGADLARHIYTGDFFKANFPVGSFDVVYERTFLCALPPEQRPAYRDAVARLLRTGGAFIGYFYYNKTDPRTGPPFGLAWGESDLLFARHFLLLRDIPSPDSVPVFAGRERWQESRRTAHVTPDNAA